MMKSDRNTVCGDVISDSVTMAFITGLGHRRSPFVRLASSLNHFGTKNVLFERKTHNCKKKNHTPTLKILQEHERESNKMLCCEKWNECKVYINQRPLQFLNCCFGRRQIK